MQFKLFKAKPSNNVQTIPSSDIATLNDAVVRYVRGLDRNEISRRTADVTVESIANVSDFEQAKEILNTDGILIVENFVNHETCSATIDTIAMMLNSVDVTRSFENEHLAVDIDREDLKGYHKKASYAKPVVNVRTGADHGMIDIFNVDKLLGHSSGRLREPFYNEWIIKILSEYEGDLAPQNLNLYINKSITTTRGFHVDTYTPTLKGFVYMTDVLSLDNGPYCFVRKTQKDGPWRRANRAYSAGYANTTEAPIVDCAEVVPVLARAGSLIISDQSGIHRGFPQVHGAERQALVMRYK